MNITKASIDDLASIMEIVIEAKAYLKSQNIDQWQDGYPNEEGLLKDIQNDSLYVVKEDNLIIGVFCVGDYEPTYDVIYKGEWSTNKDYVVIHRFAVRNKYKGKGVAKYIFDYVKNKYDYIRVDTHPDNKSMIKCLYNNGFTYRGEIFLNRTGFNLRNAYDYLSN